MDTVILEASSCNSSGIILSSYVIWAYQVNCTVKKALKALHFTMRILNKKKSNIEGLAYTSLVFPVLEYGAACWDSYTK
jgi:hypothetical protein